MRNVIWLSIVFVCAFSATAQVRQSKRVAPPKQIFVAENNRAAANEQEPRLEQINREKTALASEKNKLEEQLAIEIKNLQIT